MNANKVGKLIGVCCMYLVNGFSQGIIGPTLEDLKILTHTTLTQAALITPFRSVGYIIGAILAGVLPKSLNAEKTMLKALIFGALMIALTPWTNSAVTLLMVATLTALSFQGTEIYGNVFTFNMWTQKGGIMTQINYLSYGIGASLAPLLSMPFVSVSNNNNNHHNKTTSINVDHFNDSISSNSFIDTFHNNIEAEPNRLNLFIPYAIATSVGVIAAVFLCSTKRETSKEEPTTTVSTTDSQVDGKEALKTPGDIYSRLKFLIVFVLLGGVMMSIGDCLDSMVGNYLVVYLTEGRSKFTKSFASLTLTGYYGSYVAFRVLVIVLLNFVSVFKILLIEMTLVIVANVLFQVFPSNQTAVFIGFMFLGAGICPLYALVLAFLEEHVKIDTRLMSALQIVTFLTTLTNQFIVAGLIGANPDVLKKVTTWFSVLIPSIFTTLVIFLKAFRLKKN